MKLYEHRFTVNEKPEDYIRHVNNLRYLQWFIDSAVEHSSILGWGMHECKERSLAWVAKSHHIEYLLPALQDDQLIIYTWVHTIGKSRIVRRYKCIRELDKKIISTAETVWVLVDYETGRPKSIPADLHKTFIVTSETDEP